MDKHQYELLSCIKQRFLNTNGHRYFQLDENGPALSARQFYLHDLNDNLVRPMSKVHVDEYSRGSGSELDDKTKALRSSSAMTFNILGNLQCETRNAEGTFASNSYDIAYEYQLPTLKHGMPANLDAMLRGGHGDIVACEMKMLEWLTSAPTKLKDKYLDPANYIFEDSAPTFVNVAAILNASAAFTCYDFAQMFKHTLALYNATRNGVLAANKLVLLNCVWEPPGSYNLSAETAKWIARQTSQEHAGFQEFKRIMEPIEGLFAHELETGFHIEYLTASEFIDELAYPEKELMRLKRYR